MTNQLELIPAAPKLTPRQTTVLHALQRAGADGLDAAEAGRLMPTTRSKWDASNGRDILNALTRKGLARYRRARNGAPGVWLAVEHTESDTLLPGQTDTIPY